MDYVEKRMAAGMLLFFLVSGLMRARMRLTMRMTMTMEFFFYFSM